MSLRESVSTVAYVPVAAGRIWDTDNPDVYASPDPSARSRERLATRFAVRFDVLGRPDYVRSRFGTVIGHLTLLAHLELLAEVFVERPVLRLAVSTAVLADAAPVADLQRSVFCTLGNVAIAAHVEGRLRCRHGGLWWQLW